MKKVKAIPAAPKTGNAASVFSWLTKHFNFTKHPFQGDPNPYSDYVHKTGDIAAVDRKALIAHLKAHPDKWSEKVYDDGVTLFTCIETGVCIRTSTHYLAATDRSYSKYISFTSPKKAKYNPRPYYD